MRWGGWVGGVGEESWGPWFLVLRLISGRIAPACKVPPGPHSCSQTQEPYKAHWSAWSGRSPDSLPAQGAGRGPLSLPQSTSPSLVSTSSEELPVDLERVVLILLLHSFSNTDYFSVMFFSILYFLSKVSKFSKKLKPFGKRKDPLLRQEIYNRLPI